MPYTHSGVLASALAMQKDRAKIVHGGGGHPCRAGPDSRPPRGRPKRHVLAATLRPEARQLKARRSASSSSRRTGAIRPQEIVGSDWTLRRDLLLAEKFVAGRELTCAVIDGQAPRRSSIFCPTEHAFYDYESKYAPGGSTHVLPADLKDNIYHHVQQLSVRAHAALGCRGVSRSDFRYDDLTRWHR